MRPTSIQLVSTVLFGIAIVHTFYVKRLHDLSKDYREGSVQENLFNLLGEVEIVFGLWSAILLGIYVLLEGHEASLRYLSSHSFVEPAFVFVILAICSTRPILSLSETLISSAARFIPLSKPIALFGAILTFGPLLGSLITEPAAMTVTALLLQEYFYTKNISQPLKYATLGVLFVNVSVGGTLTPFAAPPIIMVAKQWGWGLSSMLVNFGWKGALTCVISTSILCYRFRKELIQIEVSSSSDQKQIPAWVQVLHLAFLVAIVVAAHHPILFIGLFLFFLGLVKVTREYQTALRLEQGLLVSFFLCGLVVLGGLQDWWLKPLIGNLSDFSLFLGTIGLTAIADNAAITYLGTLVPSLSETSRYALVSGAVVGGGLTVIANAPNPVGYGILSPSFGNEGISPMALFQSALMPTLVAAICFWIL